MKCVVLIAPARESSCAPSVVAALAVGRSLSQRGVRVHVICPRTGEPIPSEERDGLFNVHRVSSRAGSGMAGVLASSMRIVTRLQNSIGVDVVEVYDSIAACDASIAIRNLTGGSWVTQPVIVDPGQWRAESDWRKCALVQSSFIASNCASALNMGHAWRNPPAGAACIAADAVTEADRSFVMRAFQSTDAYQSGARLALPPAGSRSTLTPRKKGALSRWEGPCVTVSVTGATPMLAMNWLRDGIGMVVTSSNTSARGLDSLQQERVYEDGDVASLTRTLDRALATPACVLDAETALLNANVSQQANAESAHDVRERHWNQLSCADVDRLGLWRTLESAGSALEGVS